MLVAGGLWQIDRSNQDAKQRLLDAQRERSRKFAETAQRELNAGEPDRAVAAALRALPIHAPGPETPEAHAVLAAAYAVGLQLQETVFDVGEALAPVFTPDGARVLIPTPGSSHTWDVETGRPAGPSMPAGSTTIFSSSGSRVLSFGQHDSAARLLDPATGAPVGQPLQHRSEIFSAVFTGEGRRIVTLARDGIWTWDAATAELVAGPVSLQIGVFGGVLSPDGTRVVVRDRDVAQLRNAQTGAEIGLPMQHDRMLHSVAFSAGGTRILTVSWNRSPRFVSAGSPFDETTTQGIVRVWDGATGVPIGQPMRHDAPVTSAAFSPTARFVATAAADDTLRLWDTAKGTQYYLIRLNDVRTVAFSPDGGRILTTTEDTAQLWDTLTSVAVGPPRKHQSKITAALFSPDGTRILTAVAGGPVQAWNATFGAAVGPPMRTGLWRGSPIMSPDGSRIATLSQSIVRLWSASSASALGPEIKHPESVVAAAFNATGTRLITACWDGNARLWETASSTLIGRPLEHGGPVTAVAFSPDDSSFLTASRDGTARLWSAASLTETLVLRHTQGIRAAAFSPDGRRILTGSDDGTARLWNAADGTPLGAPMQHEDGVSSARFSADGTRVVTSAFNGAVRLWDGTTGAPLTPSTRTDITAKQVALNRDSTRLLTMMGFDPRPTNRAVTSMEPWLETRGGDTSQLWEVGKERVLDPPLTTRRNANAAVFSPDGLRLATSLMDRSVQLQDAATGALLGAPLKFSYSALAAVFTPDNRRLVTTTWDSSRIWDVGPPLPPLSERAATAYLSFYAVESEEERARRVMLRETRRPLEGGAQCDEPEPLHRGARPLRMEIGSPYDMDIPRKAWREACEAKLVAQPQEQRLRYQLGRALLELNETDAALAAFGQAAAAGYGPASLAIGRLHVSRKEAGKAIAALETASRQGMAQADGLLGDVWWAGELVALDRAKALEFWRSAARRGDTYAHERLAALAETGEAPEAAMDLEEALYRWATVAELNARRKSDDPYVRARRASLARHFVRAGQTALLAQVWSKVMAAVPPP